MAARLINVCAILHNLRLTYNVDGVIEADVQEEDHPAADAAVRLVLEGPLEPRARLAEGRRVRGQIILNHYAN